MKFCCCRALEFDIYYRMRALLYQFVNKYIILFAHQLNQLRSHHGLFYTIYLLLYIYTYCCIYILTALLLLCVYKKIKPTRNRLWQRIPTKMGIKGYVCTYPQKWPWKYIQNLHTHCCGYVQTQPFIPTFVGMRYRNLFVVLKIK